MNKNLKTSLLIHWRKMAGLSLIEIAFFCISKTNNSALTLYTLRGDFWVQTDQQQRIKNFFIKKLNCKRCLYRNKDLWILPLSASPASWSLSFWRKKRTDRLKQFCEVCDQSMFQRIRHVPKSAD